MDGGLARLSLRGEEALHILFREELIHDEAADAFLEFFEPAGNDSRAVETWHFLK